MADRTLIAIFCWVIVSILPNTLSAQIIDTITKRNLSSQRITDSIAREMDMVDLVNRIFSSHLSSKPDTVKIKPEKIYLAFAPAIGYTLQNNWLASASLNVSFYNSNPVTTNLSIINIGAVYDLNHQFFMPVISDIWTKDNKINFLGDWRFYRYPSFTYGLGGNTPQSNPDLINYSYFRFYQEALGHFNSFFYYGGGINYDNHFDIHEVGSNSDFETYNKGAEKTISTGPVLHFMYDSRKNINNPRDASYASITYRYNTTFLGSTNNWQSVFIELKKYIKLSKKSPDILALWSWNVFTFNGNAPYFDLPSNGWDIFSNSGRGYIQGRFRGQNMLYDEAEYRFRILNNGLIGGVVFANAESVSQYPSNKFVYIDPGEGAGLRFKMNKYSDVNLCIDYGFGLMGSRGFFFNLGEVF